MLTIDDIKKVVAEIAPQYNLKKVTLFGSRANGNATDDSDIDLIVEFETNAVSLIKLSALVIKLEETFGVKVDVIHGPLEAEDFLEVEKEIEIYAA